MPARLLCLCLSLVLLGGCASTASGLPARAAPVVETRGESVQVRPAVRALVVLRGWDRRRAAAYSAGDARQLRRLYAPGSRAGARDVAVLQQYVARGLVVKGMTVQVLRVRLLSATPRLLRIRVTDRMAGGTVVARGSDSPRVQLPTGPAVVRVVTLVDRGPRWVVRGVRRG